VKFDALEKAFVFSVAGEVITVPVATNPTTLSEVTYAVWVKVLGEIPEGNLAWIAGQAPDYGWSRALTLNDWRLGHVSITTSTYWDSQLGRAPRGCWIHVVGVWRQGGSCTVYLNGARGATITAHSGKGYDPAEALTIGGRSAGDPNHNAAVAISDVSVYGRALSDEEVLALFGRGRESQASAVVADIEGDNDCRARGGRSESDSLQRQVQTPPVWDEDARMFWFATGVNAYDIPDGYAWQREFKALVEQSKPADARPRRTLQPQYASDPDPPPSPMPPRGRCLTNQTSDPERHDKKVAHTKALRKMPNRAGFAVRVHDHRVALFRFRNRVFAVDAECPHQGGSLIDGEIGDIEDMVEGHRCYVTCPVHKFRFDLSTGTVLHGKCGGLPTYQVRLLEAQDEPNSAMVEVGFASLATDYFADFEVDDEF
jgi:nitrite reductase/ring-hydroxylating ferredoxin subunit